MAVRHETIGRPVQKAQAEAQVGRGWYAVLARTGLVAKGVSYGIVGILAIKLAVGAGGKAASRAGALHTLAGQAFGKVMLALLAIGFAAYAIWRFVQAVCDSDCRGRGLGRELLQAYIDAGRRSGMRRFRLDVSAANSAAVRLYESFGFEIVGRSKIAETEIEYLAMTKEIGA